MRRADNLTTLLESSVPVQVCNGIGLHLPRWERVVNVTLRPLYSDNDPVPIVQEAGWAPGPVWKGSEYLATIGS